MTKLQLRIRRMVLAQGNVRIFVGQCSPCNGNTLRCLRASGYQCQLIGASDKPKTNVWEISLPR
jgi:hypothetical protein